MYDQEINLSARVAMGVAKGIAYAAIFLAAVVTLLRGVVGPLVGSASDFGLLGAVLAFAGGVLGLAWLALIMVRDVAKHFSPEPRDENE